METRTNTQTHKYLIRTAHTMGYFEYRYEMTFDEVLEKLRQKWFSCGVWNIWLFEDGKEVNIDEIVKSWGIRPIYC